jgi:hypothetical protein
MDSYFVRHTKSMTVRDEDLSRLWTNNEIAIHFPGEGEEDSRSLDPDDYLYERERRAIERLVELAENGGYVWAETRIDQNVKVGVVRPGTQIELYSAIWTLPNDHRYHGRGGSEAILKTLRLDRIREVAPYEANNLRTVRPRRGTIMRWRACGNGLEALVEGEPSGSL